MTRSTSLLPAVVLVLATLAPAKSWAQRHRVHPVHQAVDPEAPPETSERPFVLGLQSYRPRLTGTQIGEESDALRRSARNHRIAGISLTVSGALSIAGSVAIMSSAGNDGSCNDNELLSCAAGAMGSAITATAALGVGLVGGVLTLVGLATWGSASGLEERAERIEAIAGSLPWIAPMDGGAVAGVRLSLD